MKTLIKLETKLGSLSIINKTFHSKEDANCLKNFIDIKFYQKAFVVLIAFSTFLIFPESPKQLEIVCKSYHSDSICNVW